jgi:hypothetical protein
MLLRPDASEEQATHDEPAFGPRSWRFDRNGR